MAPSRPAPSSPPAQKRQKTNTPNDPLSALDNFSDSLTHPSTRAQIDALVASNSSRKSTDECIRALRKALDDLPRKTKTLRVDTAYLRNTLRKTASGTIIASLFRSPNYQSLAVPCTPPQSVRVVGSYALGLNSTVDIAVEIPPNVLNEKDFLNYTYHDKRLFYLIYLARNLLATNSYSASLLDHPHGINPSATSLTLVPLDNSSISLRVLPYTTIFPKEKLSSDRRNVRPSGDTSLPSDPALATPRYNAAILVDSTMVETTKTLQTTASSTPTFVATLSLLHAFAKRHHLPLFPMTVLLHHLLSTSQPHRAPREQLLRALLGALKNGALETLQICGVAMTATLSKGLLKRYAETASTALRLIESKSAVEDPWYGVMPYLFTTARGAGVAKKPLCTMFDGFINLSHPRAEEILSSALVETGRVASIEPLSKGLFGVRVSSHETACRRVDSRPEAVPANRFREFWGDVATLRRFRDGTVVDSILWHGGVHAVREIVSHAVKRHLGEVEFSVNMGELEDAAGVARVDATAARAVPTFDELASLLRGLEGLPLSIRAVHATTPYLRHCGAFAIRPSESTRFVQPLDIVATFESSSAWPNDPVALSAAKAGFYVALKAKLADLGIAAQTTISFIDITMAGLVFRLRIRVDREKQFLENEDDVRRLVWMTETLVKHHENIRSVRSSIMGRVIRMAKRWLNAHMLLSQMGPRSEELVELIVAEIFQRQDTSMPESPFRGFCQVLHLLAEFPWEVCPLAVFSSSDDDEEMNLDAEEERKIQRAEFLTSALNKFAQNPVQFAVYCDRDDTGEAATWFNKSYAPETVIVSRIRETAKASLAFIEGYVQHPEGTLETIFTPSTQGFDVVILLEKQNLPYHPDSTNGVLRTRRRTDETLLVGFDPVKRLLDELNGRFGKDAMFMMCMNSGSEIFVVLRPHAKASLPFSLREAPNRVPSQIKTGVELIFSVEQFVAGIERIGGQLVNSVKLTSTYAKDSTA